MAVLIDTSVLIEVERCGETLEREIGEQERAISAITVSELLHGVHRAVEESVRVRHEAFVEHLLASLEALPATLAVARAYAGVWAGLERKGRDDRRPRSMDRRHRPGPRHEPRHRQRGGVRTSPRSHRRAP